MKRSWLYADIREGVAVQIWHDVSRPIKVADIERIEKILVITKEALEAEATP